MRASPVALPILVLLLQGVPAHAQVEERAESAAQQVRQRYGTEKDLQQNGFEPLSTDRQMQTVNGQPFDAQMSCQATRQFLRVSILPNGAADISQFTAELDRDMDGSLETVVNFPGPFAAVCNNGVIGCDPGTFDNCRHFRYRENAGSLELEPVTIRELGACYCFNASCGNNLLLINSQKITSDIAAGVVQTLKEVRPRLTTARVENVDPLTVSYYGQESGCGADRTPEQYFTHPNDLTNAGIAAAAQPGTVANFMLGTSAASERGMSTLSCELTRQIDTEQLSKHEIIRLATGTNSITLDCGPECVRFRIGREGDNYYNGGRCAVFQETAELEILEPQRISSLRLTEEWFDDHQQFQVNGNIVFSSQAGWGAGPFPSSSCERRSRFSAYPNVDLRSYAAVPGFVSLLMRTATGGNGEGWSFVEAHVNEGCEISREEVVDGCAAAASNPECRLENEWVDDIQTVSSFMTTGLGPLASSREVGLSCKLDSGPRAWWKTRRTYRCRTAPPQYDLQAAEERYQTIHRSFDPASGNFEDRRVTSSGAQVTSENMTLPTATSSPDCIPMCRTRKLRPGAEVGDLTGPITQQNSTGVAYDFTFKECESNTCPLEPGEVEVAPCDCRSNFAQAAALMQTIRMVGKDTVCSAPPQ